MPQTQQVLQDRYRLLQKLGHTADRQTWLAEDCSQQPGASVVVKLLAFTDRVNWENLKLFEREAKILKILDHPSIPRYLDFFSIDDCLLWFGLVHDFVPGTSLKALLAQGTRFPEQDVCQLATAVLQILIYLHELTPPVFHRDIKPSNLIWGEDERIYLIDFGAVQDKAAIEGATFTVVGTYGYAPMEQFGGRTVASSDLYALGATLIHLLTGVAPADLPQHNLHIQFADKTSLRPGLVRWIEKMTEPDVAYRFSTARAALKSLQSLAQQRAAAPPKMQPETIKIRSRNLDRGQGLHNETAPSVATQNRTNNPASATTIEYPSPVDSSINVHKSPLSLKLQLPRQPSAQNLTLMGAILLSASLFGIVLLIGNLVATAFTTTSVSPLTVFLSNGLPLLLLLACYSGGCLWVGILFSISSEMVFTRHYFTYHQEIQLFSYRRRWQLCQVPLSAIQGVFHYQLPSRVEFLNQETWNVSIRTQRRDYCLRNAILSQAQLGRDECAWLVQEIERWLKVHSND